MFHRRQALRNLCQFTNCPSLMEFNGLFIFGSDCQKKDCWKKYENRHIYLSRYCMGNKNLLLLFAKCQSAADQTMTNGNV